MDPRHGPISASEQIAHREGTGRANLHQMHNAIGICLKSAMNGVFSKLSNECFATVDIESDEVTWVVSLAISLIARCVELLAFFCYISDVIEGGNKTHSCTLGALGPKSVFRIGFS